MVMVSLGNLDGEAVSYLTGELHTNKDLNRDMKYHVYLVLLCTYPNPNGDQHLVTVFILDYETLVIDPKIRLITGDHILECIGYIREEKALIKEDYLLNLSEFKKYISDDAAPRDSGLDVIESGLVNRQEAFQINRVRTSSYKAVLMGTCSVLFTRGSLRQFSLTKLLMIQCTVVTGLLLNLRAKKKLL
ncbi:uncharacterized protein LOC113322631 [Papaver somniferum]|uniref:uncharacterized protein LOC113322631 n=1 Tax=Papaver somniferum TaxID=3469 RepID=UPI000E6FE0AD|nr:uncharacterized protein LOC113322631 [Papaver somniferum]